MTGIGLFLYHPWNFRSAESETEKPRNQNDKSLRSGINKVKQRWKKDKRLLM